MIRYMVIILLFIPLVIASECDMIDSHPEWIFCHDFDLVEAETAHPDSGNPDWKDYWNEYWDDSPWIAVEDGRKKIQEGSMPGVDGYLFFRTNISNYGDEPLDSRGGGNAKFLGKYVDYDRVHMRYYIRFNEEFKQGNFMHLSGLGACHPSQYPWECMGKAGVRPLGWDRFSSNLEPWSDYQKLEFPGRWGFYTYHPDMNQDCGFPGPDDCYGDMFSPDPDVFITKGEWHSLEMAIQPNTPNEYDGWEAFWIDGELKGNYTGFRWRTTEELKINKAGIGQYIHSCPAHQSNIVDFDNYIISRDYIGPAICKDGEKIGTACICGGEPNPDDDSNVYTSGFCINGVWQISGCSADNLLCVPEEYADIQNAVDDAGPGDTILIDSGIYEVTEQILIETGGEEGSPITITGNGAVIDASQLSGNSWGSDAINVEFADYIVIDNLEIKNAGRAGIRLTHSHNSIVRNVYSHDNNRWGIFTSFCDNILIEDNEYSGSVDEHGIYFSNSGDNPIIRGNIIHDNNGNGLHMNGDIHSTSENYPYDGIITGALVENNIMYNNGNAGGSAINCDGVRDSVIRNNLVYDQHSSGISLYQIDGADKSENNNVYHNTIIIADDGRWAVNMKDGSCRNEIKNNILFNENPGHGSIAADCTEGLVSDYNVISTNNNAVTPDDDATYLTFLKWQDTGHDTHSVSAGISDTLDTDFYLTENSLAIDAGTDIDVTNDLDGNSRPNGNGFDMGCYESGYVRNACPAADMNADFIVDIDELQASIGGWYDGSETMTGLMAAINAWKNGC